MLPIANDNQVGVGPLITDPLNQRDGKDCTPKISASCEVQRNEDLQECLAYISLAYRLKAEKKGA